MKKICVKTVIMLLSMVMILSFTACGNDAVSEGSASVQTTGESAESASSDTPEVTVGTVSVGDSQMRYAKFGTGEKSLVILPGASITFTTDYAESTAPHYSMFTTDYTVYMLDVIDDVPDDYTIEQMAQDDVAVLKELGVESMDIYGNSMGGMQGVWIAGEYPEMVNHLAVCSASCAGTDLSDSVFQNWITLAASGDGAALVQDMVDYMYSPSYIEEKGDSLTAGAENISSETLARFTNILRAADGADVTEQAEKITCPAMVFGSLGDRMFTEQASVDLADIIGCDCYLYSNSYGHCVFSEAGTDYKNRVLAFYSQDQE